MNTKSLCINRQEAVTDRKKMMCRDREKMGPCPWWRAMVCIPCDAIGSVLRAVWKMLFMI